MALSRDVPPRPLAPEDLSMSAAINRYSSRDVVVVSASDDRYAMPLAVMIRSALDHLPADQRMHAFILDGGLSDCNRERLARSWQDPRLVLSWLKPDIERVRDLPVSDHISVVAYLRLLMADLLPDSVTRAIYLDADMIVRRNLVDLWEEPQGDAAVLAVQDVAAPYLNAAEVLSTYDRCQPFLAATTPIANYRQLGLSGHCQYFNSGMLVADLTAWRRDRIGEQVLACLRTHRAHVLWWDQYALNVVLAGRWRALDHRWNQSAHIYTYPTWSCSPLRREHVERIRHDPWIIHFCSSSKPWNYFCSHPHTAAFRRSLRRTAWSDWQPVKPNKFLRQWLDFHYQPIRKQWKRHIRALKAAMGYKRHTTASGAAEIASHNPHAL